MNAMDGTSRQTLRCARVESCSCSGEESLKISKTHVQVAVAMAEHGVLPPGAKYIWAHLLV